MSEYTTEDGDTLTLSKNQATFVRQAEDQGLEVYSYSGRGMYGAICPAVTVAGAGDFNTTAAYAQDSMGMSIVLYARS